MPDAKAVSPGRVVASAALCPNCSRPDLRRSHVRFYEKPRKWLTTSRPYRCAGCRARVWGNLQINPVDVPAAWPPPDTTPSIDLSELDRALDRQ